VIGVMPERFAFPVRDQLWIPIQMNPAVPGATDERLTVFGRLRPGVSRRHAMAELNVLAASEHTEREAATTAVVMPFTRGSMSPEEEWALYGFIAGLMAFLIVTAANVANLFLARNSARQREMALRSALGAHSNGRGIRRPVRHPRKHRGECEPCDQANAGLIDTDRVLRADAARWRRGMLGAVMPGARGRPGRVYEAGVRRVTCPRYASARRT
jgi:hypothetical protein